MKAMITYKLCYGPHPWSDDSRKKGVEAWILWRIVTPEIGLETAEEPVAIFNYDSEARMFMAHVHASGTKLVEIPKDVEDMLSVQSLQGSSTMFKKRGGT